MGFSSINDYTPTKQIIWQHHWNDGSRVELTQDRDNWILIEYDSDGEPIYYSTQNGYEQSSSCEERYPKKELDTS